VEWLISAATTERAAFNSNRAQEIVMMDTEKQAGNSSRMSSDALHSMTSGNHESGTPPSEEQIRARAYELYVERGSQPGDGVGDWLQAERENYNHP
jgi:hypothetical protein